MLNLSTIATVVAVGGGHREGVSNMKNDWILDVLADLRNFAQENGLPTLAASLEDTSLIAVAELSSAEAGVQAAPARDVGHVGSVLRAHGTRFDAG